MRLGMWAIVLGACWMPSSSDPPPLQNTAPPTQIEPLVPAHTVWKGRYVCAQGITALRLTIDVGAEQAIARFEFGPLEENPRVPQGSYLMHGSLRARPDRRLELALAPDRWLVQPDNYMMVGLYATSDRSRLTLRGKIDNETCNELEVRRIE